MHRPSSHILMSFYGSLLAAFAVEFTPADYVALVVFAFASLASLIGKSVVNTLLGALIGLMLATIGIDASTRVERHMRTAARNRATDLTG